MRTFANRACVLRIFWSTPLVRQEKHTMDLLSPFRSTFILNFSSTFSRRLQRSGKGWQYTCCGALQILQSIFTMAQSVRRLVSSNRYARYILPLQSMKLNRFYTSPLTSILQCFPLFFDTCVTCAIYLSEELGCGTGSCSC